MTELLAAEWIKLRRRWMVRVIIAILLLIVVLLFWAVGTSNERVNLLIPHAWISALLFTGFISPFLWPILAGSWAGSEYSWGTIRMVLSRRPSRWQFAAAGIAILAIAVAVSMILAMIVGSLAGIVVALLTNHQVVVGAYFSGHFFVGLLKLFAAVWFVLMFYIVLAFAAGTIFRSGAVGIGVGMGITLAELVATGILVALGGAWRKIAEHFPDVYTNALPSRVAAGVVGQHFAGVDKSTQGIVPSIIGISIYIAVPIVLVLVLVRMRDVTS